MTNYARYETLAQQLEKLRLESHATMPSRHSVRHFIHSTLALMFPQFREGGGSGSTLSLSLASLEIQLGETLTPLAHEMPRPLPTLIDEFMQTLPEVFESMYRDAQAILAGDPAAKSIEEVIVAYPGFYGIAVYRIAHRFYDLGIPVFPRLLTELAHQFTGIDIHPGAKIGDSFCIDHGTGVVIGETTHIGSKVKLYQGVTLGALSVQKNLATRKRHPTIGDNVVVYSNATILGGDTVIGHDSVIGGNVWLTTSVPPYSMVYHKSEIHVRNSNESPDYS
jgi:serine O-acetyltransferase